MAHQLRRAGSGGEDEKEEEEEEEMQRNALSISKVIKLRVLVKA